MTMEDIEMERRRKSLDKDVDKLVDKYIAIMDWDIPDIDSARARQLIFDEIRQALSRLEKQPA